MPKINPLLIKEVKLFLLPVVTVIVAILLSNYFIFPRIRIIRETLAVSQKNSTELSGLEGKAGKLQQLSNSPLPSDFERLEAILPSEKNVILILSSLNTLEKQNNVLLEGFSLKPGKLESGQSAKDSMIKTSKMEQMNFSLSLIGSETQVTQFMENMLNAAPLFNINSFNYVNLGGSVRLTLDVSTYFQTLPVDIGKTDAPLSELSSSQQKTADLAKSFNILADVPPISETTPDGSPSAQTVLTKGVFDF